MSAGVPRVVHQHRAVAETGVNVVVVVVAPAAAPHRSARVVGLHHRVSHQTVKKTYMKQFVVSYIFCNRIRKMNAEFLVSFSPGELDCAVEGRRQQ